MIRGPQGIGSMDRVWVSRAVDNGSWTAYSGRWSSYHSVLYSQFTHFSTKQVNHKDSDAINTVGRRAGIRPARLTHVQSAFSPCHIGLNLPPLPAPSFPSSPKYVMLPVFSPDTTSSADLKPHANPARTVRSTTTISSSPTPSRIPTATEITSSALRSPISR